MSLTNRLTAFFLAGLTVVLAGFSITLFLLARSYLDRQLDERLQSAMNTLKAAAEFEDGGIELNLDDRTPQVGPSFSDSSVQWAIHNGDGTLIATCGGLREKDRLRREIDLSEPMSGVLPEGMTGEHRRALRHVMSAEASAIVQQPGKLRYSRVIFTVAASEKPVWALLQRLAAALVAVSLAVWMFGLVAGRRFCRRALRPVTQMAGQARSMHIDDREQRLIFPSSGDEIEALGRSFNGVLDRLFEALERQRRFTGEASHQLRTPLAALLGQVEVALRHPRTADEYRQALEQVHEQGLHLRQIVEMLLYLARADAETRLENLETLDLAGWLPAHLQTWAAYPRYRDLQLVIEGGKTCLVTANPPLLGQLLDNLIDNAFKYSDAGAPVIVRLQAEAERALLSVEDRGMGIAEADLPRLFEPFYRSESARMQGRSGVGLGLAIALRIAQVFGGSLAAYRLTTPQGSRFTLSLPRR
jgi:signal transduction histidine kinase